MSTKRSKHVAAEPVLAALEEKSALAAPTIARAPKDRPMVTVAVCTYDRYELLADCFAGLARQSLDATDFEVLVVDNTPDPQRSAAEASTHTDVSNFRWMHEAVPGLSNARNVAAREARAPIIAYIDDDAVAEPDWLEQLLAAYDDLGPSFHGVGGRVLPVFVEARPGWLSDRMLAYLSVVDLGEATRAITDTEWVAGANISYRLDALRNAGGFSPALGRIGSGISLMSNDETELAERLAAQGGRIGYAGRAVVRHLVEPRRVRQEWFRRRLAWQAVSDFVRAPEQQAGRSGEAWHNLKRFLAHQPPHLMTQRALAIEQKTSADMDWQLSAIYEAVTALLAAVGDSDD